MVYIELTDFFLLFFYLLALFVVTLTIGKKKVAPQLFKFFIGAFALRMLGSILYALVHQYYYGYGDTFGFYQGSSFFTKKIAEDFSNIRYLFAPIEEVSQWYQNSPEADTIFAGYFGQPSGNLVMKISAALSYISFNRYIIIGLFFGFFSFLGQWKLYEVFNEISVKRNSKLLAYLLLFTPSIWFWGSGLMKDSLCIGGLGFILYYLYKFLIKKSFSLGGFIFMLAMIYMVFTIKSYIIVIVGVSIAITSLMHYINSRAGFLGKLFFFSVSILLTIFVVSLIDLNNIIQGIVSDSVSQVNASIQNYESSLLETSKGGFKVSELDPSFSGIMKGAPSAIFRSLYRPFIWESGSVMILLTSLETTFLLGFSLYLLFLTRVVGFFKFVFSNPYTLFCLLVSIFFALIIGFTTFNFGTLVRYKLILLPFFFFLHVEVYHQVMKRRNQLADVI